MLSGSTYIDAQVEAQLAGVLVVEVVEYPCRMRADWSTTHPPADHPAGSVDVELLA
jgi:hypothetical protein